ncbi:sugar ABC transporter permease [Roseomonas sp. OT10]|uniref:carbohydrate ABC transporter permease n=1 Tax=Roseomonas cutis TaxID=2897332 RepID=UPI001E28B238|nr:sugar ABC transporter permease [Roseomonas sp. OT10]UFN47585.1 sugar ABC transporter permease [Roseomonas sp. OT10]
MAGEGMGAATAGLGMRAAAPRPILGLRARDWRRTGAALLFLAPALAVYATVILYPMVYSAWLSLHDWDGVGPQKTFVGLDNYRILLTENRVFWVALKNTAVWTVVALTVPTSLGLLLALALNRRLRGMAFYRSVFYFPALLSMSITGLIFTWIYHPSLGFLNQMLEVLGMPDLQRAWLSEPSIALYAVMVAAAWHNTGLPMLLYLAGLQTIPGEVLEAAEVDGARPIRRFWSITLPMLRETTFVVLAITFINALKVYDIVYVMTFGGPANTTQVLGTWMYFLTYNFNRVGLGTAIAVILFALTMIFAIPYLRRVGKDAP